MTNQKGFSTLIGIIIIVAILAIAGGTWYYLSNNYKTTPLEPIIGGDKDSHGCIGSAGYTWCEVKNKCLRVWEEPCQATTELIKNSTISINKDKYGVVRFVNGSYHFKSSGVDGYLNIGATASGNIDNGYKNITAIVFSENSGGTGWFRRIGVVENDNGINKLVDWTYLGDRTDIKSLTIENGNIVMERSIEDSCGASCPSGQYKIVRYKLVNGKLVLQTTVQTADTVPPLGASTLQISCGSTCNVSGLNTYRSDFYVTNNGKQVKVLIDINTRLRFVRGIDSETPGTVEEVRKWADFYPLFDGPVSGGSMPTGATIYGDWVDENTFHANWIKWSIG